ncbi:nephrin-like [Uloborus diversus]|uniref:nephrin-like n=1 Tax=Uloborus diversus TaxID=327109 RepID=UPI00240914F6|nr:nephrin-like [Uloborus diversus]
MTQRYSTVAVVKGDIQSFALAPYNTSIVKGKSVILHCHISNQVGNVQWCKNGTLLGFDWTIPGFDRYTLVGNSTLGEYDLKIDNAKIEDDADYECQVGPAAGQPEIIGKAHLTVLLPPTAIKIIDKTPGEEIQVKVSKSLSLACEAQGGKPGPNIVWYRNSYRLSDVGIEKSVRDDDDGRQTVQSTLRINPNPDDNKAYYECEAQSSFTSLKLRTGVYLNVLYPPGRPIIEGYRNNEKIRAGDTVNLKCISRGGNPLARLVWGKNNVSIDHSYTTSDWEATNEISFSASMSDDGAVYTCKASSPMLSEVMEKSVSLSVIYAPSAVSIKAPKEGKPGDVFVATCKTGRSNPAAEVTWVVDGIPFPSVNKVESDSKGGSVTTSEITVNVTLQDRNSKLLTCYAVNQELGETISETLTISILYAPDPPSIFGYTEGTAILAGKLQRLTCISHGGNPLPEIKWFKGGKELASPQQSSTGNIVSRELSIIVAADDNGAQYSCKSTSKALSEALVAAINLTVYFPPTSLNIKVKPKKPKAGSEIRLTCESSSSNPAANITWWKDQDSNIQLNPTTLVVSAGAENGGFSTKVTFLMNVTADDDGATVTCQALNEAIQQSVHDAHILRVFYKPVFKIANSKVFDVKQNESTVIDVTAKANPKNISYRWLKESEIIWEGPVINITSADRTLTGKYTCIATNEIGNSSLEVILKVLFPARILRDDLEFEEKVVIADSGLNVRLECYADGYPLPENAIKWQREGFNFEEQTQIISKNGGKSVLLVKNVTRDISGEFQCAIDNGIGSGDKWKIILLIKHEPIIKDLEKYNTVYSDRQTTAIVYCRADGIPNVNFSWSYEGVNIAQGNARVRNNVTQLGYYTWEGTLSIDNVTVKDFGEYKCIARNELGFDTAEITLLPDSAPDPPIVFKAINASQDSILTSWVPGFSGGYNQTHRIRYKSSIDLSYTYVDVFPPATNSVWITGLKSGVEYELAILSINAKGLSPYTTDKVKIRTIGASDGVKRKIPKAHDVSFNIDLVELLVSTIGTVFLILMVFNIILLALYCRKKGPKKKLSKDSVSSEASASENDSEETTFSSFTSELKKTVGSTSSSYHSLFTSEADSKSVSSYSSDDINVEDYSEETSTDRKYEPEYPLSKFV